jgi:hypothetical protein
VLRSLSVLFAGLALLGACGARSTPDIVGFAPELLSVDGGGAWVQPTMEGAVAKAHWLRADAAPDVPRLPITLELGQLTGAAEVPVLRLVAQAHPPEAWRARWGDELEAVIEIEPSQGELDPEVHGGLALDRAMAVLDAKVGIELDGRAAIATLLAADDPQIVVLALDWVIDHRGREYADEVARLVPHPDERVALRAVECLGVVGEPRHARVLVQTPRLADRAYAQRIYDALARLGGEEAQGFLEFAARNEDDPLMMEVAADALSRLHGADATTGPQGDSAARGHR